MKNLFGKMLSRSAALNACVLAVAVLAASQANAALPDWATGIMTAVSGNITDVIAAIGPIFAVSVGGFFIFKLIKRGIGKL